MKPPKLALMLLLLATLILGSGGQAAFAAAPPAAQPESTLTVFAAASLTEAFTEAGVRFEAANPGVEVVFNFAGSQQLAQQLSDGAPADVFASANNKQMGVAIAAGRVADGAQTIFVHNRLVAITPLDNRAGVLTLHDLGKPGVDLVLAAKEVPVGQYALDFLDKAAADSAYGKLYKEAVLGNVVSYEETVKAVLTKVVLGEGDAGIVYVSDISQDAAGRVLRVDIPDSLNTIADYPMAPVSDSAQPELAKAFIDFVLSPTGGQQILERYNFVPAGTILSGDVTVFAAASLTEAFTEAAAEFEATNPGVHVILNLAGSQQLSTQLAEGAPADVFASANTKQMGAAIESGRVADGAQAVFVHNRLVVITPVGNPAGVTTLRDMADPGMKLVLAAKEVPVGQYSLDFLDKATSDADFGAGYKEDVLANVVSYEDNVKAVLTKVVLGEGDAGIVYLSDISQDAAGKVEAIEIPDELNTIADYPIAPVTDSRNPKAAQAFIEYVLSPTGVQPILEKYNFVPVATIPKLSGDLTVFAAASLTEAFTEAGAQLEKANPDLKITFNFAGSQQLAQQLADGAPADVFASANVKQLNLAIENGRVADGTQTIFAHNRLVVVTPLDNRAGILTLHDLAKPKVQLVLAAKEVPVGQYSLDFLDKAAADKVYGPLFKNAVLGNVVTYEETVKAVLTKVVLGEGDAGIVYVSDISQDSAGKVLRIDVPDSLNTVADYPIAPVSDSAQPELAQAFIDYVLSADGMQPILAKYSFVTVAAQ